MSPNQMRTKVGISLYTAAEACKTTRATLRLYEIDPLSIRNDALRTRIDAYYERLRTFVGYNVAEVA